jgi:hypothetical protein
MNCSMWASCGCFLSLAAVILVVSLFTSTARATPMGCNRTRAAVLECIELLFDLDSNGVITPVEADVAISRLAFVPAGLTWQFLMRCDLDEDGQLTMADWNVTVSNTTTITCLPTQNCLDIACNFCSANGFVQSSRDAPQPGPQAHPPPANLIPHGLGSKIPVGNWREAEERLMEEQRQRRLAIVKAYNEQRQREEEHTGNTWAK